MTDSHRRVDGPNASASPGLIGAIGAPLAVGGLAYLLWAISDQLGSIGPFDRATFGWLVVIPLWLAAPLAAGLTWRNLGRRESRLTALLVAMIVAGIVAVLFWQAVAFPDCAFGPRQDPVSWWLPSMILGAIIGAGLALGSLLAGRMVQEQRPWRAVALGVTAQLVALGAAMFVVTVALLGSAGCQRPH